MVLGTEIMALHHAGVQRNLEVAYRKNHVLVVRQYVMDVLDIDQVILRRIVLL